MKLSYAARVWLSAILALAIASLAPAQQPTQQPPPPPPAKQPVKQPPKPRKVWNNEDLKNLRQPADKYEQEKTAAEAAAAKQKAEQAKAQQTPAVKPGEEKKEVQPEDFNPPKTLEEAEKRLSDKREEITFQEEKIRQVRSEYFDEKDSVLREELRKRVERMEKELDEAKEELKKLEASVAEFKAKKPPQGPGQP